MFELIEIASPKGVRNRVFPVVLPDSRVFEVSAVIDYVKYWEERIKDLDAKMRQVGELTSLEGVYDEINLYRRIRDILAKIMGVLRDMNARSIDDHKTM